METSINLNTVTDIHAGEAQKYVLLKSKKSITALEAKTLLWASQWKTLQTLAHESYKSVSAIKASLKSIREKLGAENTAHAISLAFEAQIFQIVYPKKTSL